MKLYPHSSRPFRDEIFLSPPAEYRGTPFWSWNTKLDKTRLKEQMEILRQMGMGGFHIHSRIGLDTEYLGEEFLDDVRFCVDYAREQGMGCWLYDEDKWPSGYGAGLVTKDPEYKNRFLLFSPERKQDGYMKQKNPRAENRLATGGEGRLAARYEVTLKAGRLAGYRRLGETDEDGEHTWFAYVVTAETSPWFNNQSYGDTLNRKAMEAFVRQIYERYYEAVGEEFGKTVPAVFTDEPQFSRKDCLDFAEGKEELKIPFTEDLEEGFCETYGQSLLDSLPELFWEPEKGVSRIRYQYHDYVAERFAQAYGDTLGQWCREHQILLTGHMMEEPKLGSQTRALGEAMRQYRSFGLPGVDMLADAREYTTVKQAQSASRQYGCPGVLSELYGVTNWDFDFRGHKLQGDWQAALGVTQRVHHLSWLSMKGESKRDYPAPIDEHSPWYLKYHVIEDYFARLNSILTRGRAVVTVGLIHPIESYWLYYGPNEHTGIIRDSMEDEFERLARWLLSDLTDFDYICESQLPRLYSSQDNLKFHVGQMAYSVILVPHLRTIRKTTAAYLREFAERGGAVFWLGAVPEYMDAEPADQDLFDFGKRVPFEKAAVSKAVDPWRQFTVKTGQGEAPKDLICQVREDGEDLWIFLAHGEKTERASDPEKKSLIFQIRGSYDIVRYDAMSGGRERTETDCSDGMTRCRISCFEDDSILLRLTAGRSEGRKDKDGERSHAGAMEPESRFGAEDIRFRGYVSGPAECELLEPNVLLLDRASCRTEDGGFTMEKAEVLKIEDELRRKHGWSLRSESYPQPWLGISGREEKPVNLILTFSFRSDRRFEGIRLAAETEPDWTVELNGQACSLTGEFWLDRAFSVYCLPTVREGENRLTFRIPFGSRTALEWCYLTGSFGVRTDGINCTMTDMPRQLEFGDISRQDLPFYGGNIRYRKQIRIRERERLFVQVPNYAGALVSVKTAGDTEEKDLFCSPYMADLGIREPGEYELEITLYGNRFNMFGQLHNCNRKETYYGPWTWRTEKALWSREYQTKPAGILSSPLLYGRQSGSKGEAED